MNAPSPAAPAPQRGEPQSSPPAGRGGVYFKIELKFQISLVRIRIKRTEPCPGSRTIDRSITYGALPLSLFENQTQDHPQLNDSGGKSVQQHNLHILPRGRQCSPAL